MGVAVGRAVSIGVLRIINHNSAAAHLKHPQSMYDFYAVATVAALSFDLSCCKKNNANGQPDDKSTDTDKEQKNDTQPSKSRQHCLSAI